MVAADEADNVAAEFRRSTPPPVEEARAGVELSLSSAGDGKRDNHDASQVARATAKPFEFLDNARIESLVPYLAREQALTIAVVLSYLMPDRAALVLAALPARLQVETMERLSALGETDRATLNVLERELAAWLSRQKSSRSREARRTGAAAAILAAADESTRNEILRNISKHNPELAGEIAPPVFHASATAQSPPATPLSLQPTAPVANSPSPRPASVMPSPPRPRITFDDLARLDQAGLNAVLKSVETELLVLALAGADEEIIDRIANQMPSAVARTFREKLTRLGPTRLRDVAAAQQEIAAIAAQVIQLRRRANLALIA
jgi:flagellar motor switch protein FliG